MLKQKAYPKEGHKGNFLTNSPRRGRVEDEKNIKTFKKFHKKTFYKSNKIYAREKVNFSLKKFIENWKEKYQRKINEMSISELNVV